MILQEWSEKHGTGVIDDARYERIMHEVLHLIPPLQRRWAIRAVDDAICPVTGDYAIEFQVVKPAARIRLEFPKESFLYTVKWMWVKA